MLLKLKVIILDTLINKPKVQGFPTIKMYNNGMKK